MAWQASSLRHGELWLTDGLDEVSAAWYRTPVRVDAGFLATIEFRISRDEPWLPEGDGFAFVVQSAGLAAIGVRCSTSVVCHGYKGKQETTCARSLL